MSNESETDVLAPSLSKWLREPLCLPQVIAAPFRDPVRTAKVGGGRPVIVIPGMASGDSATALLRSSLDEAGFRSFPTRLGRNLTISPAKLATVEALLAEVVQPSGPRAIVVGWSLGGFYARLLAQRHPSKIALVATLGTPFSGNRRANNAWRIYELLANHTVDNPPLPDDPAIKPESYTIAFWSPIDGIVAPASARGHANERDEAVELPFRHFELGCSKGAVKQVIETIGDRLNGLDQTTARAACP